MATAELITLPMNNEDRARCITYSSIIWIEVEALVHRGGSATPIRLRIDDLRAPLFPEDRLKPQSQRAPGFEKIQSREAVLKKSSFQYRMKFSIENEIFIPGPSLAAEKQGLGLKFSIGNEIFKPRMKISCVGEWFFHAFERE